MKVELIHISYLNIYVFVLNAVPPFVSIAVIILDCNPIGVRSFSEFMFIMFHKQPEMPLLPLLSNQHKALENWTQG